MERIGSKITGPLPFTTSKSTPMPGSGVRMSENMMTPSVPKALNGWRESSIAISGVSDLFRKGYLSEKARKSFM
eukprot:479112-Rhodomonas_salina.2